MARKKEPTGAQLPARYSQPDPEENDGVPVEMPLGACRPTPLSELLARAVHEMVQQQTEEDYETPEEADDFEEDDPDTLDFSEYEFDDVEPEPLQAPEPSPEAVETAIKEDAAEASESSPEAPEAAPVPPEQAPEA